MPYGSKHQAGTANPPNHTPVQLPKKVLDLEGAPIHGDDPMAMETWTISQ